MTTEQIKQALSDFNEQEYLADLERQSAARRIKAAEQQICNSYNRNYYSVIYKPEYGDYRKFVEQLASELRKIQKREYKFKQRQKMANAMVVCFLIMGLIILIVNIIQNIS